MTIMRREAAGVCLLGLALVIAAAVPAAAQQGASKKLDKAQQKEGQALYDVVQKVVGGQPAPSDFEIAFGNHFLKARDGSAYVPYTVTLSGPGAPADGQPLALLVRVLPKGQAPAAAGKDDKKSADAVGPFVYFSDGKRQAGQPFRFSHAIEVKPGEYDLYLAIKEREPANKKKAPPVKMAVLKQPLVVPDFGNGELTISSVIVTDKIDQLPAQLPAEKQIEKPYAIGLLDMQPSFGMEFAKTQELGVYFQVYNPAVDAAKMPDVRIEYTFYRKQDSGEKAVANTDPRVLNATTLPAGFDVNRFLLLDCQAWMLERFVPGAYRLEIKVTDKLSGKTLTHSVNFKVV